ncbi:hypothetical protein PTSG_03586 [Salpingoeca rosetta]|uniref:F-box domain-containing protein n=1 Tax=Salpingoeca rosetta (strain ATCC 50818 / BSB-021) TaxID=946362 RepID=F2U610_SALR5|nr:uncharacterized protein PTSG_03586 [Salpingoeca rosetta]EGD82951.1 hypothetical protein PTSG_03586 [Salpingoeca rosetta]|eukprot:XP_004995315.1 hypothetical protein PTSG_03586 [Salpingoeca rosetta]
MRMQLTASGGFAAHIADPSGFNAWRSDDFTFDTLPRELRILILSFLPPEDLFRLAAVNRNWYDITNDPILWRHVLMQEMPLWPTVTSATFPNHHALFKDPKATYRRCSPLMGEHRAELSLLPASSPPPVVRHLFARHRRFRVAVFGAGLEHIAHGLVTEILWGADSPFQVLGMSPGTDGVGGGVSLRVDAHTAFDMITLYQKTAAERARQSDEDTGRLQNGRGELRESERRVCEHVDAFVMVVDAARLGDAASAAHVRRCCDELQLFMNPAWTRTCAPLVVWNCSSSATPRRASAVQAAEVLRLPSQPRVWRVEDVCVENFAGPISRTARWLARNIA